MSDRQYLAPVLTATASKTTPSTLPNAFLRRLTDTNSCRAIWLPSSETNKTQNPPNSIRKNRPKFMPVSLNAEMLALIQVRSNKVQSSYSQSRVIQPREVFVRSQSRTRYLCHSPRGQYRRRTWNEQSSQAVALEQLPSTARCRTHRHPPHFHGATL